mgnify:CR=1 FL=1
MIITIDTSEQTVEILNEDTKDWEPGYIKGMTYTATIDDLITIDFEIALPYGMR